MRPPQSWPKKVMSRRSSLSKSTARIQSTWRGVGVVALLAPACRLRPKPTRSGATHAVPGGDEHRDHVPVEEAPRRLAVQEQHRRGVRRALVEVVDARDAVAVGDLDVVRLERVVGQRLEALVGGAQGLHRMPPGWVRSERGERGGQRVGQLGPGQSVVGPEQLVGLELAQGIDGGKQHRSVAGELGSEHAAPPGVGGRRERRAPGRRRPAGGGRRRGRRGPGRRSPRTTGSGGRPAGRSSRRSPRTGRCGARRATRPRPRPARWRPG